MVFSRGNQIENCKWNETKQNKVGFTAKLNMLIHDDERSPSLSMFHIHLGCIFFFYFHQIFIRSGLLTSLWWWLKRFSELSLQIDTVFYPSIKVITCKCVNIFMNFCQATHTRAISTINTIVCSIGNIGWIRSTNNNKKCLFSNSWRIRDILFSLPRLVDMCIKCNFWDNRMHGSMSFGSQSSDIMI